MFSKLRFAHKIVLMPILAAAGVIIIFVTVQVSSSRNEDLIRGIDEGWVPGMELARDLEETLAQVQRGLQDAAGAADAEMLTETDVLRDRFLSRLEEAQDNVTLDRARLEVFDASFREYYALARRTTEQMTARQSGSEVLTNIERMRSEYNDIKESLGDFTISSKSEMQAAFEAVLDNQRSSMQLVLAVMLMCIGALAWLSWSLTRSITAPIGRVMEVADELSRGKLTGRIDDVTGDEVGQMSSAINRALESMQAALQTIGGNATRLDTASDELTGVSQQMASSAEETSSQASRVSEAADEVSRNVQTVATGVEEMTASIKEIAHSAHQAASVATSAVEVASSTNDTITKLGESSAKISGVINVITSIAEQTNLLALNATIEAARAGEAGKGFAVVANEVKELAKETAAATEEIGRRIKAIQGDASSAVAAIGKIGVIINEIFDIQNTIASAVEEQTATTNEISRYVTEAADRSSEIAQSISGVADAAQGTTAGATATREAADELIGVAADLQTLVAKFEF